LTLAAGQLVGFVLDPIGQAHARQGLQGDSAPDLRIQARIDQRQLHVVQRVRTRQEIKGLKHEPDLAIAHIGQFIVVHLAHVHPV
jgi:hypothetical protein